MNHLSNIKSKVNETIGNLQQSWENLIGHSKKALTKFTSKSKEENDGEDKDILQQWHYSYGLGLIPVDLYEEENTVFVRISVPTEAFNALLIYPVWWWSCPLKPIRLSS